MSLEQIHAIVSIMEALFPPEKAIGWLEMSTATRDYLLQDLVKVPAAVSEVSLTAVPLYLIDLPPGVVKAYDVSGKLMHEYHIEGL